MSDVLETFNIAVGHGTDGMMLTLPSTRPVWTSQTRCSPSTQPVASSTNSSCRPTDHSGAPVTMIDGQVNTVTILMVGLLDKTKTRSLTHMVVSNPASPPMMVQTVWLVNIQTSFTAIPQVCLNFTFIEKQNFIFLVIAGFCINKELVCDGHPHPSCGGDDEGVHCLEDYFKKRIVKRYATLFCNSKIYPGK